MFQLKTVVFLTCLLALSNIATLTKLTQRGNGNGNASANGRGRGNGNAQASLNSGATVVSSATLDANVDSTFDAATNIDLSAVEEVAERLGDAVQEAIERISPEEIVAGLEAKVLELQELSPLESISANIRAEVEDQEALQADVEAVFEELDVNGDDVLTSDEVVVVVDFYIKKFEIPEDLIDEEDAQEVIVELGLDLEAGITVEQFTDLVSTLLSYAADQIDSIIEEAGVAFEYFNNQIEQQILEGLSGLAAHIDAQQEVEGEFKGRGNHFGHFRGQGHIRGQAQAAFNAYDNEYDVEYDNEYDVEYDNEYDVDYDNEESSEEEVEVEAQEQVGIAYDLFADIVAEDETTVSADVAVQAIIDFFAGFNFSEEAAAEIEASIDADAEVDVDAFRAAYVEAIFTVQADVIALGEELEAELEAEIEAAFDAAVEAEGELEEEVDANVDATVDATADAEDEVDAAVDSTVDAAATLSADADASATTSFLKKH